jgi:hypothetical protein
MYNALAEVEVTWEDCETGVVEYEVSMSRSQGASTANFSKRFLVETVLSLQHQSLFEIVEDQDNTSFTCALFARFIPLCGKECEKCQVLCQSTQTLDFDIAKCHHLCSMQTSNADALRSVSGLSLPFFVHWQTSAYRHSSTFAHERGTGLLLADPSYMSSGNACWELEMLLGPDQYGNETYEINVSTTSLSGNKSVSMQIKIVVNAVNDSPSFLLPLPKIYIEENQFVTLDYVSTATFRHFKGPFEEHQNLSFNVSLVSGDGHMFAQGPQIYSNGSLIFRLLEWQRGSAVYAVILKDDGLGSDSSPVQDLTIYVHPVNRVPSFAFTSPVEVGWDFEDTTPMNFRNGSLRVPEGFLSAILLHNFAADLVSGTPMDRLEAAQHLSFQLKLISGNDSVFAQPPHLASNGSLFLRLNQQVHGVVEYNVTLYDDGCHGDSEFITHGCGGDLACDSCASDCLRISTTREAYDACSESCKSFCACAQNATNPGGEDIRCVLQCRRKARAEADGSEFLNVSRCTGANGSNTESMRVVVEPVNDAPDFDIFSPFIEVMEHSYAIYGQADVTCSGSCECTQSSGTSSGTISQGYLNYSSSHQCTWFISASNSNDLIAVTFPYFDTEDGHDYVTINECSDSSPSCSTESQLAHLSGSVSSHESFTSNRGYIQVIFTSEAHSISQPGFVAVWSIVPQFKGNQHKLHVFPHFSTNIIGEPSPSMVLQKVHFTISVVEASVSAIPGHVDEVIYSKGQNSISMITCDSPHQCTQMALLEKVLSNVSMSPEGNLSFTLLPFRHGVFKFSCELKDDAGTAFGGKDISQAHSFAISVLAIDGLFASACCSCM